MGKTQKFHGYNTDIERLATRIETYLTENGFEVAFSKDQTRPVSWCFIQARKLGALRTAAGARRSTDISIRGSPDNFEVSIGTGEWGKNLIMSAPLFVVPVIGIAATLTKIYTAKRFEDNLWKYIKEQANFLRDSGQSGKKETSKASDQREFDCDYVEGYPGWSSQVLGGKLILERQKKGTDQLIFEAPDGKKIQIPAANIEKATIISRKKGLAEHDLMIELTCKDKNKTIHPVINLADDIIAGVLAGINEIVAEDKYLRDMYKN
ncbi:MAG: hypothetical protein QXE84_05290 [Candidatus Nitrosotenuis sp.]|uniref:Uncharacterized protein n=1 Tax=Candidatus Nitrosotenuis uzonensis TaxID=1407055 RepID=V6AT09_9ARCH|nr:hypothetical protein [Candidatus Nitrosotenuis uzonensis]CAE6499165.1 conserved hypothetical protein [Candidatus Nitrosotenuis uzonensis]CDI05640.1 hypothetical protein NITUZ_30332 [Candidatus Nitrosotenuis uzonensis]